MTWTARPGEESGEPGESRVILTACLARANPGGPFSERVIYPAVGPLAVYSGASGALEDLQELVFQALVRAEAVQKSLEHRSSRIEMHPADLLADALEIVSDPDVGQAQAVDWLGLLRAAFLGQREDDLVLRPEVVADHALELAEGRTDLLRLPAVERRDQLANQPADLAALGPPTPEIPNVARCLCHRAAILLRTATAVLRTATAVLRTATAVLRTAAAVLRTAAAHVATLLAWDSPCCAAVATLAWVTLLSPHGAAWANGLAWRPCGDGLECAALRVPVEHERPERTTLEIALIRRPAGDPARRIGPLVVNPGGPGASGVGYLRATVSQLDPKLLARFDVVSFDPRGVGRSAGLDCHDDLARWLSVDPSPDDEAEWLVLAESARALAQRCADRHGGVLPHVGTPDVARDLELLRRALGAEQLSYLGLSYGSLLGAVYAELHPERVRAFVLDGALLPGQTLAEFTLEQSVALERAFEPPAELSRVTVRIEREGIPSSDGARPAGPADLTLALAQSLYLPHTGSRALRRALARALEGDGSGLVSLADTYLERRPDGSYPNSFEANLAVTCLDLAAPRSLAEWRAVAEEISRAAPLFGLANWNWAMPCVFWPAAPAPLSTLRASGAAPILVVARIGDPVTPFAWGEGLATALQSGVLLPVDGPGHTSSTRGDECVDAVIRDYLLEARLPQARGSEPATLPTCP